MIRWASLPESAHHVKIEVGQHRHHAQPGSAAWAPPPPRAAPSATTARSPWPGHRRRRAARSPEPRAPPPAHSPWPGHRRRHAARSPEPLGAAAVVRSWDAAVAAQSRGRNRSLEEPSLRKEGRRRDCVDMWGPSPWWLAIPTWQAQNQRRMPTQQNHLPHQQ